MDSARLGPSIGRKADKHTRVRVALTASDLARLLNLRAKSSNESDQQVALLNQRTHNEPGIFKAVATTLIILHPKGGTGVARRPHICAAGSWRYVANALQ